MKILFIGTSFGNSYLQYLTLKRMYNNVDIIDTDNDRSIIILLLILTTEKDAKEASRY